MKKIITSLLLVATSCILTYAQNTLESKAENEYGIWTYTFGTPEAITPTTTRTIMPLQEGLTALCAGEKSPVVPTAEITPRGILIHIPLQNSEKLYGLGLQMKAFQLRGSQKRIKVNSDSVHNLGDSHAPVPFYVSTAGYGIFIDSNRYLTYYLGNQKTKGAPGRDPEVVVEVPFAQGVKVMVFEGPTMKEAVARYNLYSGGGTIPTRWGLGFWYRGDKNFNDNEILAVAEDFRNTEIPCDVMGLEPGWQTRGYSCSFVWSDRFPDPAGFTQKMLDKGFRLNLWQHCFVHPTSPVYEDLFPYSGNYMVWDGLVPDYTIPEARKIFADYMRKVCTGIGVSGFKADECDDSDYTGFWSFQDASTFPSGADGEQMHTLLGLRYKDALMESFEGTGCRTYGLVRSGGAFEAPYPFVLYSDLYDHQVFINSIASSSFSGLLWTPEVREAGSEADLIRRMQSTVLSPLAMVNAWYFKHQPWYQVKSGLNNRDELAENREELTATCREIINLRMKLVPYIHAAFVRYHNTGIPPFRALVMDYPDDPNVYDIAGQYMIGDNMMAAPMTEKDKTKTVYFPKGIWYDFFTGEKFEGGQSYELEIPLERTPLFVKENTLLPLAKVTQNTDDPQSREITVVRFGDNPEPCTIYSDDNSENAEYVPFTISVNPGKKGPAYLVNGNKKPGKNDFYKLSAADSRR